jgi:hypothetical protein
MLYLIRLTCLALMGLLCVACTNTPAPQVSTPTAPAQTAPAPGPPTPPPTSIQDDVTGDYDLTLDIGSGCSIVPASERIRTYSATVTSPEASRYLVTLTSGAFLGGSICTFHKGGTGCNQFTAERAGDRFTFDLVNDNDDAHGGHIVEQTLAGTWLEIIGQASGARQGTSIEASGTSDVWYCSSSRGYPFPCPTYAGCTSDDMRLRFVRK